MIEVQRGLSGNDSFINMMQCAAMPNPFGVECAACIALAPHRSATVTMPHVRQPWALFALEGASVGQPCLSRAFEVFVYGACDNAWLFLKSALYCCGTRCVPAMAQ